MLQANTAAKHWPGYQTYPDPQLILGKASKFIYKPHFSNKAILHKT